MLNTRQIVEGISPPTPPPRPLNFRVLHRSKSDISRDVRYTFAVSTRSFFRRNDPTYYASAFDFCAVTIRNPHMARKMHVPFLYHLSMEGWEETACFRTPLGPVSSLKKRRSAATLAKKTEYRRIPSFPYCLKLGGEGSIIISAPSYCSDICFRLYKRANLQNRCKIRPAIRYRKKGWALPSGRFLFFFLRMPLRKSHSQSTPLPSGLPFLRARYHSVFGS